MKEIQSNINIVGGGLVGSLAAHSLATLGYKISILEKILFLININIRTKEQQQFLKEVKDF